MPVEIRSSEGGYGRRLPLDVNLPVERRGTVRPHISDMSLFILQSVDLPAL